MESVTFILRRPDRTILMQLRDDGRGRPIRYPNTWTFPGGEKEEEEAHLETTVREIYEEFRLRVSLGQCRFLLSYDHDDFVGDQVFLCEVPQDAKPELHEGAKMKWMSLEEIEDLTLAFQLDRILPQLKTILTSS